MIAFRLAELQDEIGPSGPFIEVEADPMERSIGGHVDCHLGSAWTESSGSPGSVERGSRSILYDFRTHRIGLVIS